MAPRFARQILLMIVLVAHLLLVSGCGADELGFVPEIPVELPKIPVLPGLPSVLRQIPGLWEELGLPDLSEVTGLPDVDSLPTYGVTEGAIAFRGPTEQRIVPGETIPGTDIRVVALTDDEAEFLIAGLTSRRRVGDSLDFDGPWPGASGVTYNLRLRIYRLELDHVRVAGVQQLIVEGIAPTEGEDDLNGHLLRFPFLDGVAPGETISGTTLGFVGAEDRGARLSGLPDGDYPYRKVADSIRWRGRLRHDIPVEFSLRMMPYDSTGARVGGTASVALPAR